MATIGASTRIRPIAETDQARHWAWWPAALVLGVIAYGPLLWMFFNQQWQKEHYQFFPFVIAAFGWLLWRRYSDGTPRTEPRENWRWFDGVLLASSLGVLMLAIAMHSPWCALASLILLAAYACQTISRTRDISNLWGVWALLLLLAPLPFGWDQKLISVLQHFSSKISSFALDLVGVNHVMEGNVLWLPGKKLFVDEACSGIISILSVVACAVIFGVIKNRTPLHLVLLALAGIFWATIVNVGRISTIAFVYDRWAIDWSAGAPHEILSLVLFLATFLALLSTDQALLVALAPIRRRWQETRGEDLTIGTLLVAGWDAATTWGPRESATSPSEPHDSESLFATWPVRGLAITLLAPAAIHAGLLAYAASIAPERLDVLPVALSTDAQDLPDRVAGLDRVDFHAYERSADDVFGRYSKSFTFRDTKTGAEFLASFDFPFAAGWHELTACYVGNGWTPTKREVHRLAPVDGASSWDYVEVGFERPGGEEGVVFFAEFDQAGQPLSPQLEWHTSDYSFWKVRNTYLIAQHAFQVQVWAARDGVVSDAERDAAERLLLGIRDRLRNKLLRSSSSLQGPAQRATGPSPQTGATNGER